MDHYYWYRMRDEVGAFNAVNSALHYFPGG